MKKFISIISLLLGVSSAWATVITDDFNRADSGLSGNGNVVGADWENSRTNLAQWGISGNQVVASLSSTAVNTALYNTALETVSGGGTNFTLSLDVEALKDNQWGGIAFNYQNPTNFYYFRFKSGYNDYQMYRYVDGASQTIFGSTNSVIFASNTVYTLTVSSSSAYVFDYEIKEGGTTVVSGTATDANSNFTGGYAGIFQTTAGADRFTFDNFSLEVARVSSVVDDFNRADSSMSGNGNLVGPNWENSRSTLTQWGIVNNQVVANLPSTGANTVLYNTVLETISGNGTNFIMSLDVKALKDNQWGGIAFNYQNPTNFYWLRFKSGYSNYAVSRFVNGSSANIATGEITGTFASNTVYTLTVASPNAYEFIYEIKEAISGTVLISDTTTDSNASFTGGYAGALQSTTGFDRFTFDNFSLEVGPEILTPGYAGWAAGWGIDIGAETNDYDLDGLLNIYEYGLGGDPTDPGDQGTPPEFAIVDGGGSNVFNYVYPQLSDPDSGLTYSLALGTDLVLGDWATNTGYVVTGTNVTGETLDFVTNVTDTVAGKKFIRLIIE